VPHEFRSIAMKTQHWTRTASQPGVFEDQKGFSSLAFECAANFQQVCHWINHCQCLTNDVSAIDPHFPWTNAVSMCFLKWSNGSFAWSQLTKLSSSALFSFDMFDMWRQALQQNVERWKPPIDPFLLCGQQWSGTIVPKAQASHPQ